MVTHTICCQRPVNQKSFKKIERGDFDLVLVAPPCSTFSRALFADLSDTNPLRNYQYPRGLPQLSGSNLKRISEANKLVDFSIQALAAVAYHGLFWLEFREELGECKHGVPASVWNWPSLTELAKVGYLRGALYQREWSSIKTRKPTGILSNIAEFMSDPDLHPGWPAFSSHQKDGSGRKYQGPLPHQCKHAVHYFDLLGTTSDGDFHTFSSAAYHTSMCSKLAGYFVEALVMKFSGNVRCISPLVVAFSGVSNLSPIELHFSQVSSLSLDADHMLGHSGSISLGLHELLEPDGSSRLAVRGDMGLLKRFNAIVLDVVLRSGHSFVWTSFQLQKNVAFQSHVDQGVRTSVLLAWVEFSGCEFVQDREVSVKDSAIFFETHRTHCAKRHHGNRYSLVAYVHPKLNMLTGTTNNRLGDPSAVLVRLRSAGFRRGLAGQGQSRK